jgi:hypothetical protein
MKFFRPLPILTALALVSACAAPQNPQLAPLPPPRPRPVPTALPTAPAADWRDAALTPGNWTYDAGNAGSVASFGIAAAAPLASLRCDRAAGRMALTRAGTAPGPLPLKVTTSTLTRAFTATPQATAAPQLGVALAARDPVLDAIAFSRGRFVIEVAGLPTLYLPAWPEVARVIEDCR